MNGPRTINDVLRDAGYACPICGAAHAPALSHSPEVLRAHEASLLTSEGQKAAPSAAELRGILSDRVEIEWWDSERVTLGWASRKEYRKALADRTVYRTCGYLVGEDDDSVMVALSRNDRGAMYSEAIVIPKAVIIRRSRLVIRTEES